MRKYSFSKDQHKQSRCTLLYFYSRKELRTRIVTFLMLIDQTSRLMVYSSGNILEDFTPFLNIVSVDSTTFYLFFFFMQANKLMTNNYYS